jgi:hypothetical protein
VRPSPAAEIEVRVRFDSAAVAGNTANIAGCDLHRLHRTAVHRSDSLDTFMHKVHGGGRLEGAARDAVGSLRARRARRRRR